MAARDRERESGACLRFLSRLCVWGGAIPRKTKMYPRASTRKEKLIMPCEDTPVLRQGPQTGPTISLSLSLSLAAMSSPTSSYLLNNIS